MTIDVLFDSESVYDWVVAHPALSKDSVSTLLRVPGEDLKLVPYPAGRAIKVSFPRSIIAGSPNDTDVTGGQQYAALVDVELGQPPLL